MLRRCNFGHRVDITSFFSHPTCAIYLIPLVSLLRSYASRESDDVRIKRLIMPFANQHSEGVVVVWAMGKWTVHILDLKVKLQIYHRPTDTRIFPAFPSHFPSIFTCLARNLFQVIESSGGRHIFTVRWSDLAQRFALDAIGSLVIGHSFNSIHTESQFVTDYNQMMHDMAEPLYLVAPFFEWIFPRQKVSRRMDRLFEGFNKLLEAKRSGSGEDLMTMMMKHPDLSQKQLLDNMAAPFLAACIREALRINPPGVYVTPRISPVDVTLGSTITRQSGVTQKEPWYPFSTGARQCPAYNFALYELRTLVALLLQRYEWCLPQPSIHTGGLKNGFSAFVLALPAELDIAFSTRSHDP
ncbi:cytochrome P450 [Suillus paluster]|uniref:cytochrome P450 n=1 Tax=Suillus paluster TaxID=48578 RepID=UPI001B864332|nr:cytochrome P450 [Suillus paluster]KAG1733388.1 cytochrome P450 [Suillus paluster]